MKSVSNYSENTLRNLYQQFGTGKLVAEHLNVSYKGLMRKLKRLGITSAPHKRRTINEHYFSFIDSEAKAYFLGFFFCDGYISDNMQRFQVNLTAEDGYILERFCQDSNATYEVSYKKAYAAGKIYQQSRLSINRSEFIRQLVSQGILPGKENRSMLPNIPNNLIFHFIRGMYDADGYMSISHSERHNPVYELGFVAYSAIIEELNQIFVLNDINDLHVYRCGGAKVYTIGSAKRDTVYKIGSLLYNNATVYLQRKKDRFDEFMNRYFSPSIL